MDYLATVKFLKDIDNEYIWDENQKHIKIIRNKYGSSFDWSIISNLEKAKQNTLHNIFKKDI